MVNMFVPKQVPLVFNNRITQHSSFPEKPPKWHPDCVKKFFIYVFLNFTHGQI